MSERYKITAGSHVGWFLPLKGWGGTGAGISRGGTGHWWHKVTGGTASAPPPQGWELPAKRLQHVYLLGYGGPQTPKFSVYSLSACMVASSVSLMFSAAWSPPRSRAFSASNLLHLTVSSIHPCPPSTLPPAPQVSPAQGQPPSPWLRGPPSCASGQRCPSSPTFLRMHPSHNPGSSSNTQPLLPQTAIIFSASFLYVETSSPST